MYTAHNCHSIIICINRTGHIFLETTKSCGSFHSCFFDIILHTPQSSPTCHQMPVHKPKQLRIPLPDHCLYNHNIMSSREITKVVVVVVTLLYIEHLALECLKTKPVGCLQACWVALTHWATNPNLPAYNLLHNLFNI